MRTAAALLLLQASLAPLRAGAPLQVGLPLPRLLDLRRADAGVLLPADPRDPAQVERARRAWLPLVEAFRSEESLRLLLPLGESRAALLLAASQALKAQNPGQRLYLAYDAEAPSMWDPSAWGACEGGILAPEDLGSDPGRWRDLLAKAQEQLPGRPWFLWAPQDPGPRAGVLLGDGGRLVVPPGGVSARLAAAIPPGFTDVEGGLGDLTLHHRDTGQSRRWCFVAGEWRPMELPKGRHEVSITAKDSYDVAALLDRMRATQLRDLAAIRTLEARLVVQLHLQSERGTGADLAFEFQSFAKAGETEELLQECVKFNGVRANIKGETQLPIVESRASLAAPVVLGLTERYRYLDGGPAGPGRRILRFVPVDRDPLLFEGELLVDEGTGRVLEERSHRSELPGIVKSERRTLLYGEPAPGLWRVMHMESFERWVTAGGVAQVQRRMDYSGAAANGEDFEARRQTARGSASTMLKQTTDGMRYFTKQANGSRKIESKPRSSGAGLGVVAVAQPGMKPPVLPFAGLAYFDFNALDRGIQVSALTAVVYNTASLMIPHLPGGFDVSATLQAMLWPSVERPVAHGRLQDREGVDRSWGNVGLGLGRDLGAGFRAEFHGFLRYDRFRQTKQDEYRTEGFEPPPSGWTRGWNGQLGWQFRGFQLKANYGGGQRPDGTYGEPGETRSIPEQGRFRSWGGSAGYDHRCGGEWWLHGELGHASGWGFDRFLSLGSAAGVAGIRTQGLPSDRVDYAKAGLTLPPSTNLRLTCSLEHARYRALDDRKDYGFTGLQVSGDIPGFWWFTTVRVDLGVGLLSDVPGLRTAQGYVALLKVF